MTSLGKDAIEISLNGETAIIDIVNGKIICPGYDIEEAKQVLFLSGGYGEGISVLLVALEEEVYPKTKAKWLLEGFESDLKMLVSHSRMIGAPSSRVIWNYLSFSPIPAVRKFAVRNGVFSILAWERLLQNPDIGMARLIAGKERLPCDVLTKLAQHPNKEVRLKVAKHPNLDDITRISLARDPEIEVRKKVYARMDLNNNERRRLKKMSGEIEL